MVEYTIKDVTENDVKELQAISQETFKATFDECTAPADMARFLKEDYATEKLLAQINNSDSRFFFLIVKEEVAGYLKVNVNSAQTENVKPNALEVERIYLRQKFQHQGLGLVLIKLAEEIARKENYDYMWLGVYENNLIAQKFYKKDGFTRVGQHVFQVGEDPQIDYILAKKLD